MVVADEFFLYWSNLLTLDRDHTLPPAKQLKCEGLIFTPCESKTSTPSMGSGTDGDFKTSSCLRLPLI